MGKNRWKLFGGGIGGSPTLNVRRKRRSFEKKSYPIEKPKIVTKVHKNRRKGEQRIRQTIVDSKTKKKKTERKKKKREANFRAGLERRRCERPEASQKEGGCTTAAPVETWKNSERGGTIPSQKLLTANSRRTRDDVSTRKWAVKQPNHREGT